ncbi:hypothetical protein ABUK73_17330 [Agrobacterium sp. BA1120]
MGGQKPFFAGMLWVFQSGFMNEEGLLKSSWKNWQYVFFQPVADGEGS